MSGARYDVVMLPGDGVGAEVAAEAERVLQRVAKDTGNELVVDKIPCGGQYYLEHGTDWPAGSEARCKEADLILLGAVGWPSPDGPGPVTMKNGKMAGYSPVIGNRTGLDLFANVRPVKLYEGVSHTISGEARQVWNAKDVDMVFLRENTEGLYVGSGGILAPGGVSQVGTDTRVITRRASERIIRMAYEMAMQRDGAPKDKKRRVTCVVKNNVLFGCRLFAEIFAEVGKEFPEVEQDVAIIDAFTQWLITRPEHYDVIVTTNMFGDIITDLAAVLQGGMGMAVGCNVGADNGMFEPIHGSAPDITGQDKANPMAMILATAEGLIWLGQRKGDAALVEAGKKVEAGVRAVLKAGEVLPADLAGERPAASTSAVTDAILAAI
ncbi:unnamed protein product [Laminaria digitata]